jgi:meiotically up-regulated gene 157 (Mug157) protein
MIVGERFIDQTTRELIDRLLLERTYLAGIARATKVYEQVKPVILSDLMFCGNKCLGLSAKHCLFQYPWRITLGLSGISFVTTMHHYFFSTTRLLNN